MSVSLQALQAYVDGIPANQYLNMKVLEKEAGYVKVTMPYNPEFTNTWRNVHGGALMTFADIAFFIAQASVNGLDGLGRTSTAEMKTNFLRPTNSSQLYAEARVIKNGRRLIFGCVEVIDQEGNLIIYSTVTYIKK